MADIKVPKTEEAYINDIYDRQKESTLRTLKSAYDSNVASIDTAKKALDTNSYEAKREATGDAAITRQRLNEAFAANGLNTGAVGQANLALLNQKAANLNKIDLARQQAQQEYDAQKAALMQTYQAEVKSAIQQNDADRAKALYAAWKEQQAKTYAEEQAKKLAEEQAKALAAKQAKTTSSGSKRSSGSKKNSSGAVAWSDGDTKKQPATKASKNDVNNAIRNAQLSGIRRTAIAAGSLEKATAVVQNAIDKGAITQAEGETIMQNLGADAKYLGKGW